MPVAKVSMSRGYVFCRIVQKISFQYFVDYKRTKIILKKSRVNMSMIRGISQDSDLLLFEPHSYATFCGTQHVSSDLGPNQQRWDEANSRHKRKKEVHF